ncbi:227 kDa spindle and centromere-associated protein-like protein [Gossypium australe]|uniref:227 kDa spindle and centromere-associated protein-like protein n=1 Tax=Gossypium australe TaxID=47621 RepID=A0A5B6URP1_9ROSI|nr:227 kDa spindle and centromere-associated protein-like protein [Gossypium australe]
MKPWKSLSESRNEQMMELKASLSKIEEMKKKIEELEMALQNCQNRIESLEVNEGRWKEELHYS